MRHPFGTSVISHDQQVIARRFSNYILGSVVSFIFLSALFIYPQIRSTFYSLQDQSDESSARTYASILDRYLEDREYSLSDIAQSTYLINALLLAEGDRAYFRDFINQSKMLREDPILTVLDINADVLYSEDTKTTDFGWALPLLEEPNERILTLELSEGLPLFQLAIPIQHGRGREGVIIAKFSADPDKIFHGKGGISDYSGVVIEKNDRVIQSNLSQIELPHSESQFVEKYGITISHITSRRDVIEQRRLFIWKFIFFSTIAAGLAFTLLVFYGRRIILRPFIELAASKEAIAKAVEGISRVDPQGRYIEMNSAYANNAGYVPDELIGKDWSLTVHPDDLEMLNSAYADMIANGSVTAEARGIKKDGSVFYKQVTMISQYDENQNFVGHHCFMKDISERRAAEVQREQLLERLSDSNEELERFAFVCSHDLQEPLRMIRSFSEKLQLHLEDHLKDDDKGKRYLHFVTDGAQRSQELIRDILSYSSIGSDTSNLELVDLNALVQVIQTTMHADQKNDLKYISWDILPSVMGNKTQLYQLLQNLINNGLKYQSGDTKRKVHVGVADNGQEWVISVKDNGIGIAENHLGKIFEVFQRLHRRNEYAGTGVGLSICKKVVERHDGEIWVESQIGQGSTFFFTLPKLENLTPKNITPEKTDDYVRKAS